MNTRSMVMEAYQEGIVRAVENLYDSGAILRWFIPSKRAELFKFLTEYEYGIRLKEEDANYWLDEFKVEPVKDKN